MPINLSQNNKYNDKCNSCLMPFKNDKGIRESDIYCSLCFKNGELCYKGNDVNEFSKVVYDNMVATGSNKLWAKFASWSVKFAPRWKK